MALPDLETLGRLKPDMLVVVYDDAAYGAEVHHFRPMGIPVELAQFPPTDFAALATSSPSRPVTQWIGASKCVPTCSPMVSAAHAQAGPRSS